MKLTAIFYLQDLAVKKGLSSKKSCLQETYLDYATL